MSLEDRRSYPPELYPYRNAAERDRTVKQLRDEYAHLPQFVPACHFFLLPPATKTAQEIGAKPLRNEFHNDAKTAGKRFATANGFARMEGEKGCCDVTGKGCSGKPSLSLRREGSQEPALPELRLLVKAITMMAGALAQSATYLVTVTQELRRRLCPR